MSPQATNKAIVSRFFEEVINQGKIDVVDEIMAPDFVEHYAQAGALPGRAGFKQFIATIATAFPDLQVKVNDIIAEKNKVVVRVTVVGTHKGTLMEAITPTGKRATWVGTDIFVINNGKISERWSTRDIFGLLQQLGVIKK